MQKVIHRLSNNFRHQFINHRRQVFKSMNPNNTTTTTTISTAAAKTMSTLTAATPPSRVRPNPAVKKIDTPEFKSIFTEELHALIGLFEKYNYELRIAGGAVRDILMHIQPKDVDLATTATPDQMKEMFTKEEVRMINAKGEKHGTITPRINNKENFEVTTLRIDVLTDGRHAEVQFTTDWQLDANRRDLTINSMFLGFDGTVYDYFYGYEDLQERKVVFVGQADIRIREDYLRILRYFRFYGRIAKDPSNHDAGTLKAIQDNVEGMARISGERIWGEFAKILQGNFAMELTLEMFKCGLAKYIGLPEDPNEDEFRRVFERVALFPGPHHSITYVAALLHTAEDAMRLHERLKLSAFERDVTLFITQHRDLVNKEFKTLKDYQMLCMQPAARRDFVEELLKYSGSLELYKQLKEWEIPSFPVTGNMLKSKNCPAGKKMGHVMSKLKMIWAQEDFQTSQEDLLEIHLPKILAELPPPSPPAHKNKKQKMK
ncbi:CCA tRNA nucleotidyltransferase 1, mitochondrial [Episyrphus balteatus]|uniref:CCA tRNA nucleotidyltransferase 1, mitochondrial n=1 Tax=Episyrphus balteatus TaxID=286459 RepID=UPI00248655F0|nr:CCA tRNA nucleotidyltransferase 1, mitochondrial [Episyrphus balteatus]